MTELVAGPFWSDLRANKTKLAALFALAAGSILIRLPFLKVPMLTDEGFYAFAAHFVSTKYQLYRDLPLYRPQGIVFVYDLILAFGDSVVTMRSFAGVYNALSVLVLFALGRAMASERVAWTAAALFALFGASPHIEGFTANAEIFAQLPMVIAALLTWRRRWAWAGFAAGVAFLLKPSALGNALLIALWCLVTRAPLISLFTSGAAFFAALLPSIAHGAWIGWQYFWDSIYARRVALMGDNSLSVQIDRLTTSLMITLGAWCVPAMLTIAGMFRRIDQPRLFGLLWLLGALAGMSMGGFWFWHYFIQMMPPLCLLAALGLETLLASRLRIAWIAAVLLTSTIFIVREGSLWTAPPKEISWQIYHRAGYLVSDQVAKHVAANTTEKDSIFVCFGQAEIYYLARRKPSFPYMFYADFEYSQQLFDGAIATIRDRRPARLILVQPPPPKRMRWGEFLRVVGLGYEIDKVFSVDGATDPAIMVFRRKIAPTKTEPSNVH
jgi:hypothetical protein